MTVRPDGAGAEYHSPVPGVAAPAGRAMGVRMALGTGGAVTGVGGFAADGPSDVQAPASSANEAATSTARSTAEHRPGITRLPGSGPGKGLLR